MRRKWTSSFVGVIGLALVGCASADGADEGQDEAGNQDVEPTGGEQNYEVPDSSDDDATGGDGSQDGEVGNDATGDEGSGDPGTTDEDPAVPTSGWKCGDPACTEPEFGTACCTSQADVDAKIALEAGMCGIDVGEAFGSLGCTQLDQPGTLDEACPDLELGGGAPPMQGCCTSQGKCGVLDEFFGFGCGLDPYAESYISCGE